MPHWTALITIRPGLFTAAGPGGCSASYGRKSLKYRVIPTIGDARNSVSGPHEDLSAFMNFARTAD